MGRTIVRDWAARDITGYVNGHFVSGTSIQIKEGDRIGLAVPAGSLSISVLIFSIEASVAIAILAWRRYSVGSELGMKYRWTTFGLFLLLYFGYCSLSTLVAYDVI